MAKGLRVPTSVSLTIRRDPPRSAWRPRVYRLRHALGMWGWGPFVIGWEHNPSLLQPANLLPKRYEAKSVQPMPDPYQHGEG